VIRELEHSRGGKEGRALPWVKAKRRYLLTYGIIQGRKERVLTLRLSR
jgi:hypothetical protein